MEIMQDRKLDGIVELTIFICKNCIVVNKCLFSYQTYIEIGRGEMFCLSPTFIWFRENVASRDSDAYTGIRV